MNEKINTFEAEIRVYIPDTGSTLLLGSPIVLYQYPDGSAPVEGKPQKATVRAAEGYRYQWYVNNEEIGNGITLELKAADYCPGMHSLALIFREDGRDFPFAEHLTFRVVPV
jgi:hypothetical protein